MNDRCGGLANCQNKAWSILELGKFIEIMNSHLDRELAINKILIC